MFDQSLNSHTSLSQFSYRKSYRCPLSFIIYLTVRIESITLQDVQMVNGHLHARRLDERGRHQRVHQHHPQRSYRLHLWLGPRECYLEYVAHMGTWKHVYSGENFNNHFEVKAIKKARSFFDKKKWASFFWWCLDINDFVTLNSDGNEKNNFEHLFSGLLHFYSSS